MTTPRFYCFSGVGSPFSLPSPRLSLSLGSRDTVLTLQSILNPLPSQLVLRSHLQLPSTSGWFQNFLSSWFRISCPPWFRISCPPCSASPASLWPCLLLPLYEPSWSFILPNLLFHHHPFQMLQRTRTSGSRLFRKASTLQKP